MTNIVEFIPGDTSICRDNEGKHMDTFGQVLLTGIFSDLCCHRDRDPNQGQAAELDAIIKRLGKVIARYEP